MDSSNRALENGRWTATSEQGSAGAGFRRWRQFSPPPLSTSGGITASSIQGEPLFTGLRRRRRLPRSGGSNSAHIGTHEGEDHADSKPCNAWRESAASIEQFNCSGPAKTDDKRKGVFIPNRGPTTTLEPGMVAFGQGGGVLRVVRKKQNFLILWGKLADPTKRVRCKVPM